MSNNARDLALAMGVGQFQADMIIPYMWMTPSTTDPDMPAVRVMVEVIQDQLEQMGSPPLRARGELDVPTATWLRMVTGPTWVNMTWARIFGAIMNAKNAGRRLATPMRARTSSPAAVGALPDFSDPTTLVLMGAAALLWFNRKKL
jgi:hypothetical protein